MIKIKEELKFTVHTCHEMNIYKSIMIDALRVWEVTENSSSDTLIGRKVDWLSCPYCGMDFYEEKEGE